MACSKPLKRYQLQDSTWTGIRPRDERAIMAEIDVGCGKCLLCRKQRATELATRFEHESQLHELSAFVTLTYSNENLPALGSTDDSHVDKFIQDLRNTARRKWGQLVRYDIISEYSPEKRRPHYHGLLFGVWPPDATVWRDAPNGSKNYISAELSEIWPHGLITFQLISPGSCAYMSNHQAFKKRGRALDEFLEVRDQAGNLLGHRASEHHWCSKHPGIGAGWFAKYGGQAIRNQFTVARYHKTAVPKYYRRLAGRIPELAADLEKLNAAAALAAIGKPEDNTPERLAVREDVEAARQRAQHARKGVHR